MIIFCRKSIIFLILSCFCVKLFTNEIILSYFSMTKLQKPITVTLLYNFQHKQKLQKISLAAGQGRLFILFFFLFFVFLFLAHCDKRAHSHNHAARADDQKNGGVGSFAATSVIDAEPNTDEPAYYFKNYYQKTVLFHSATVLTLLYHKFSEK